jgi:hypothetical protein
VGILVGIGDGSFQARTGIQISSGGLQAGDFNEDGNLDLVSATNTNTNTNFNIALVNGNGTFQSPTPVDTGATSNNLTVGDFNNDSHLDVASYGRAHEVRIALGDGSGSFVVLTDSYPIAGSGGGRDLFVGSADFNGDGNIDIVADRPISGDFTVLLGAGDGTFQTLVPFNVGFGLGKAEVADINGDGTPDLVTTFFDTMGFIESGIGISVSNGDGTFKDTQYFYAGGRNFAATVGDFNADGAVDVATANLSGASVTILLAR